MIFLAHSENAAGHPRQAELIKRVLLLCVTEARGPGPKVNPDQVDDAAPALQY